MKQLLIAIFVLISLTFCANAEEPAQKYQIDFTLRYNAVDANTMRDILIVLETLRVKAGSVELVPCKWDVSVKKAGGYNITSGNSTTTFGHTIGSLYDDNEPNKCVCIDGNNVNSCPCE